MPKVLLIAALHRELAALTRGWPRREVTAQNRRVTLWESDHAIAACAGIGGISARIAADTAYRSAQSDVALVISLGLAGALTPELRVADIVRPRHILDSTDGLRLETAAGEGTLVTSGAVAEVQDKRALAHTGALAVDMEAFAVADVARIHGVPFIAIKSISDERDFSLPPLGRFITADGGFSTARFALWTLVRPWCWLTVIQLGRNSAAALRTLTQAVENTMQNHTQQP